MLMDRFTWSLSCLLAVTSLNQGLSTSERSSWRRHPTPAAGVSIVDRIEKANVGSELSHGAGGHLATQECVSYAPTFLAHVGEVGHFAGIICDVVAILRGGELAPEDGGSESKDRGFLVREGSRSNAWRVGSKGPLSFKGKSEMTEESGSEISSPGGTFKTQYVAECLLPTARGKFRLRAYRHVGNDRSFEPVVMVAGHDSFFEESFTKNAKQQDQAEIDSRSTATPAAPARVRPSAGELEGLEGVPVRVHDQCLTSEVLGSLKCDCKQQLELALDYISEHGGCVIYMQQEGRGIGLANKVAAYALQDGGLDTVDANRHLGFDDDLRSYEAVEHILADMGIKSIKLMTNNPFKLKCLKAIGIEILSRIPMLVAPNAHSIGYLQAKADRMSHFLHQLDDVEGAICAGLSFYVFADVSTCNPFKYIKETPPLDGITAPVALPLDGVGAIRGGDRASTGASKSGECEEIEDYAFGRDSVLAAIEAVREGKCVVVTDDEARENEGDIVFAAAKATEDLLAFTIRHSSGVICASLEEERLKELRLPQMVKHNEDPKRTAFTISVDAKLGTSTGISAGDRAQTLRQLANAKASPQDFHRPGHIFPLRSSPGGVLERAGHTEAAVDLVKLAGLPPVGVLCEITTKDGKNMARVPELREFCAEHGLVLTSIQDIRCLIRETQRAQASRAPAR